MDSFEKEFAEVIIKNIKDPLMIIDPDMRVKYANTSFYRLFNCTATQTVGELIYNVNLGDYNKMELAKCINDVLTNRPAISSCEIHKFSPSSIARTMLLNPSLINVDAATKLILLTFNDISAFKDLNLQLAQSNRELENYNKELASFSYIASHDLQEPLRKISTFSTLVLENEENNLSESGRMYMDRIEVSANRMQQLIDDLLAYSYINNLSEIDFSDTDLNLVVRGVLGDLEETIENKKAAITVSTLPTVKGRDTLLHQLFINLIGNSLKYSNKKSVPEIKISFEIISGREIVQMTADKNTAYYKIKIEDNGIGFRAEQAHTIFEPFKRLHSRDKYEGSGIGLAICNKIVTKHKGFINAESTPGIGSTFNIFLPL